MDRHGGAMGVPCQEKMLFEKNVSILMLKKLFHKGHHASAMGKKIPF